VGPKVWQGHSFRKGLLGTRPWRPITKRVKGLVQGYWLDWKGLFI